MMNFHYLQSIMIRFQKDFQIEVGRKEPVKNFQREKFQPKSTILAKDAANQAKLLKYQIFFDAKFLQLRP